MGMEGAFRACSVAVEPAERQAAASMWADLRLITVTLVVNPLMAAVVAAVLKIMAMRKAEAADKTTGVVGSRMAARATITMTDTMTMGITTTDTTTTDIMMTTITTMDTTTTTITITTTAGTWTRSWQAWLSA
nr:hypothetical protein HUO10_002121 [Paraburkholderia busanensis]